MLSLPFCLILAGCLAESVLAKDLRLLILHNNDMHARFEETDRNSGTCKDKTSRTTKAQSKGCVGGFARTAHEIRRYRKLAEEGQGPPVLYLNGGDTFVGTAWFGVHKAQIAVDFLNLLEPDAMSLGNHEFDFGAEGLAPLLDSAKFPIVAANLDFSKEPRIVTVKKSVILTVSGEKIGIIGHLTNETIIISNPGLVGFLDVVQSVKEESEKLDQQGIKIIIALGHSGYEMDKRIAAEVPLVDVVIGGHTNTFQWNGPPPDLEVPEDVYPTVITQSSGKKVPVVQAYAFTKYLGRLNVTFNEDGDLIEFEGQPELLETSIPQDGDVLDLLDRYRPEVNALNNKVIGHSKVILDATNMKCRVQECNFGNMVADAFVFYMASLSIGEGWTQYPIGLMNGGSIRTTVDPTKTGGNITRGELFGALPFDSQLVSLQLTGKDLIQTLEIGARGDGETSKGEFLQVSGVHVVYNISQPKYSRVVSVKVRCGQCKIPVYEDVVPDRLYGVATLNFLTRGGDGHFVLKDKAINLRAQDLSDLDVTDWYLQRYSPVYPAEEGRIQFVSDDTVSGSGYSSGSSLKVNRVIVCLILCAFSCFN